MNRFGLVPTLLCLQRVCVAAMIVFLVNKHMSCKSISLIKVAVMITHDQRLCLAKSDLITAMLALRDQNNAPALCEWYFAVFAKPEKATNTLINKHIAWGGLFTQGEVTNGLFDS